MIVIDDFIKDQDLLNRLKEDNTFGMIRVTIGGTGGGIHQPIHLRKS